MYGLRTVCEGGILVVLEHSEVLRRTTASKQKYMTADFVAAMFLNVRYCANEKS